MNKVNRKSWRTGQDQAGPSSCSIDKTLRAVTAIIFLDKCSGYQYYHYVFPFWVVEYIKSICRILITIQEIGWSTDLTGDAMSSLMDRSL